MKKLSWFLLIIIVGCSSEDERLICEPDADVYNDSLIQIVAINSDSITKTLKKSDAFKTAFVFIWDEFINSIKTKSGDITNEFIHPSFGLYYIENIGALPKMTKAYSSGELPFSQVLKIFQTHRLDSLTKPPVFESLPQVICDTSIYDKQGCFAEAINPLLKSRIWNYANLNEKEIQAIEVLAETVSITVVNTANFTFYFSKIEGEWYLTFLDLREPCQA